MRYNICSYCEGTDQLRMSLRRPKFKARKLSTKDRNSEYDGEFRSLDYLYEFFHCFDGSRLPQSSQVCGQLIFHSKYSSLVISPDFSSSFLRVHETDLYKCEWISDSEPYL